MKQTNLDELTELLCKDIDKLLHKLGIEEYCKYGNEIRMACPIHSGDNPEGLTLFIDGYDYVGNWYCWTNHCEEEIVSDKKYDRPLGNNIFGFIRGVISQKEERHVEYSEAIDWAKQLVGDNLERDYVSSCRFTKAINYSGKSTSRSTITRDGSPSG